MVDFGNLCWMNCPYSNPLPFVQQAIKWSQAGCAGASFIILVFSAWDCYMKIIFAIAVTFLIAGCQSYKDYAIYNQAKYNFVYEADKENELRLYDRVDKRFYGDCEDFAFTLQKTNRW